MWLSTNALVSAIMAGNQVDVDRACSALGNNYDQMPLTSNGPPEAATATLYEQGKDAIYSAQHRCHGGLIRSPDLATASQQAHTFELALCFLSRRRDGPTRRQTENQGLGVAARRWRRAGLAAAAAWRSRATESR